MPAVIDVTPPPVSAAVPCAESKGMLDAYTAAERAALSGISVRWGERSLTRANLSEITAGRREWERKYADCLRGCQNKMGAAAVSLASLNEDGCNGVEGSERWNIDGCGPCR